MPAIKSDQTKDRLVHSHASLIRYITGNVLWGESAKRGGGLGVQGLSSVCHSDILDQSKVILTLSERMWNIWT